jgi:hypothetical protein
MDLILYDFLSLFEGIRIQLFRCGSVFGSGSGSKIIAPVQLKGNLLWLNHEQTKLKTAHQVFQVH